MLEARHEKVKKMTPTVTRRLDMILSASACPGVGLSLCRLILVRHGQYTYAEDKGDEEHKLTPLGREQARITGRRLSEYLKFLKDSFVDKYY